MGVSKSRLDSHSLCRTHFGRYCAETSLLFAYLIFIQGALQSSLTMKTSNVKRYGSFGRLISPATPQHTVDETTDHRANGTLSGSDCTAENPEIHHG